jgi:hypothetical protein
MGDNGGNTGETQDSEQPKAYRFYFDDRADTLGGAADQQIPEDAIDQQIVTNDRSEDEWQEMQLNDVNYPELMFDDKIPRLYVTQGSVEEIEQKTIQMYQNRQDSQEFKDQHDAEIFTESVLDAVLEVTNASTGPKQSELVENTADYIATNNEQVDLQNYKLSSSLSMIGDAGTGFSHPIGLLQYEEDGESQVRYAEIENRMTRNVVEPENSVYDSELGTEDFIAGGYVDTEPSDWVSVFDYEKRRELEEQGKVEAQPADTSVFWALTHAVDDAALNGYDMSEIEQETGVDAAYSDGWINAVVSDSFGESLEEYVKNPEEGDYTREDFETAARTVFTALETENFGGEFALDGDLANPEVYKAEKETLEEIRADMAYDEVGLSVVS